MKDKVFGVLQRVGRSFMLPIAILPVAGLLLGVGSSFTNATTIETYHLQSLLGEGTILYILLTVMSKAGNIIFDNLPIIFAVGVAIGMAKKEKEVAALSAMIAFFVMHATISSMLFLRGDVLADGSLGKNVLEGTIAQVCGIQTLQMGVFGGIIVGIGVSLLHNKYHKIVLPNALSFFGGSRFVPIISTITYVAVGLLMYFIWPFVQNGIYALGSLVTGTGYFGTLIFGIVKRALIPFGLHHVFYLPFWQTAVGGSMEVGGKLIQGGQNIFFAQLADPSTVHFSSDATRYFSGEFIFMIFGLPGAALAMYRTAKPEKKKQAKGLLFSAALTSILTGITEPIEFSFLFVAPILFAVQVVLAGAAYMIAHVLNIAVGLTFSGGFLDLFIFGILQGNGKTSWMLIIPVGIVYFFLYYFIFSFLIVKLDLKTPGREDEDEMKLFTKADYLAKQGKEGSTSAGTVTADDMKSALIVKGLGGKDNISDVDCCATRLRCTVLDASKVDEAALKQTGPSGILKKGQGIQIIYGPSVSVIKSNVEDFLASDHIDDVMRQLCDEGSAEKDQSAEKKESAVIGAKSPAETMSHEGDGYALYAPFSGKVKSIEEAPDEAFAGRMMGDGYVIEPAEGVAYAPEDAVVSFVFPSKHAVGLQSQDGVEYLLHIGVDTVALDGQGFEAFVSDGQTVKKGDKLIAFDIDYIRSQGKATDCMIVFTNMEDGQGVALDQTGDVKALDHLGTLK